MKQKRFARIGMTYQFQKERYMEKPNSYWCKKCKIRHNKNTKPGLAHYKFRSQARGFCYQLPPVNKTLFWEQNTALKPKKKEAIK